MVLKAGDTISGQEGTAFIERNGSNEPLFYLKQINGTVEKQKVQIRTLGRRGDQNKTIGWAGTGGMTIHKVTSVFVEMAHNYIKNGIDETFNIMVTNEDPASSIGAQRVVLKDVSVDSYPIALLDVDAESLEEDLDFTFDDLDLLSKFKKPASV